MNTSFITGIQFTCLGAFFGASRNAPPLGPTEKFLLEPNSRRQKRESLISALWKVIEEEAYSNDGVVVVLLFIVIIII